MQNITKIEREILEKFKQKLEQMCGTSELTEHGRNLMFKLACDYVDYLLIPIIEGKYLDLLDLVKEAVKSKNAECLKSDFEFTQKSKFLIDKKELERGF